MVRKKEMIALPDDYWQAIENKIDGVLIRSKGDALITLLRELHQARPDSVKFDEFIYIKLSEFQQMKNELAQLRAQMNAPKPQPAAPSLHPGLTQERLNTLLTGLGIAGRDEISDTLIAIVLQEHETGKKAGEMLRETRRNRDELKKRVAELEGKQ